MLTLSNGWVQWDYQLSTFRGELDGKLFGVFGGEYLTAADWVAASGMSLNPDEVAALDAEKTADDQAKKNAVAAAVASIVIPAGSKEKDVLDAMVVSGALAQATVDKLIAVDPAPIEVPI